MKFIKLLASSFFFICLSMEINAQEIWTKTDTNVFELNTTLLNASLTSISKKNNTSIIINFPDEKGNLTPYRIVDNSLLPESLAIKYPGVHAYKGINLENTDLNITLTCTPQNISATIINGFGVWSLRQLENTNMYSVLDDSEALGRRINCGNEGSDIPTSAKSFTGINSSEKILIGDNTLRILRTAITVTGEYSDYFVNKSQLGSSSDEIKKAAVLGGIVTSLNNLNTVFERDLGIRFELVENNDELIFLDENTDPFLADSSDNDLIDTGNLEIVNSLGLDNFDIGHVLSIGFSGLAAVAGLCSNQKGEAVSASPEPEGTEFDFTLFAHEVGHQLGATHTQNSNCQRTNTTAVEPGSGSTIMGYAGFCTSAFNIQSISDEYFHLVSINQIKNHIQSVSCGIESQAVLNSSPVIEVLPNYTIPANTNFILEAKTTDADDDSLTYCWEQMDIEIATMPPVSTSTEGPLFRSLLPTSSPNRNFPEEYNVNTTWEVLPSVSRDMNFGLTVRDGNPGGIASTNLTISVVDTEEQFEITTSPESSPQNSVQQISWNVAGTDSNGINTENVTIELSYDNGLTFPVILAENTLNDGEESIIIPIGQTSEFAKIKITPIDNIYYTISDDTFTITEEIIPTLSLIDRELLTGIFNLKITEYTLYDMNGRSLVSKTLKPDNVTLETFSIDLNYFERGIYILKMVMGSHIYTRKIIKE